MGSEFPYGYVESVNVDDDKDCERAKTEDGVFTRTSDRILSCRRIGKSGGIC